MLVERVFHQMGTGPDIYNDRENMAEKRAHLMKPKEVPEASGSKTSRKNGFIETKITR